MRSDGCSVTSTILSVTRGVRPGLLDVLGTADKQPGLKLVLGHICACMWPWGCTAPYGPPHHSVHIITRDRCSPSPSPRLFFLERSWMLPLFANQHHTVRHSSQLQLGNSFGGVLRGEQTGEAILPSKEVALTSTLCCSDQLHGVLVRQRSGMEPSQGRAVAWGVQLAECYIEHGNDVGLLPRGWKGPAECCCASSSITVLPLPGKVSLESQ